jgi:hypothetical protein
MALTTEDGTAKADADSLCALAYAGAYHAARGITLWATMLEQEREQAIRRATQHIGQVYRYRWAGWRKTDTQALDWPRYDVPRLDSPGGYISGTYPGFYSDSVVPDEVQRACAELAFKAASGDLSPDLARLTKREKVDVIEVEYEPGGTPWVRFRSIDNILAGLMKTTASGTSIRLARA